MITEPKPLEPLAFIVREQHEREQAPIGEACYVLLLKHCPNRLGQAIDRRNVRSRRLERRDQLVFVQDLARGCCVLRGLASFSALLTVRADVVVRLKRQGVKAAKMVEPSAEHDRIAHEVVDAAFVVHTTLGPGLLESAYEQCMAHEQGVRELHSRRQLMLPIVYRGYTIEAGYRMDMVVGELIVVEIKAVEKLLAIHEAQLDTYLKLSGYRSGLLMNFNVPLIRYGIRRRIWSH